MGKIFCKNFWKSKRKDSSEILEVFKANEEVFSTKEGPLLKVLKRFLGLRRKDCAESFWNEVKISFNFSFNFPEEVSMMSLTKEDVLPHCEAGLKDRIQRSG